MSEKTGLFVDSFPILHNGHQLCLKYASQEVDKLITILYDTPNANIPLPVRANWLKQLYPNMEIIESWFNLEGASNTTEAQKQFLMKHLQGREITHFYSTQPNLEHLCKTLHCENRLLPPIRAKMQKATNQIQDDSHGNISRLNPIVYQDLITNVAFVGAQSTGKSTITEAMAKKYHTNFMFEYGRYHWDVYQKDRIETLDQIVEITERHLAMENERLKTANKYLFTDTCPLVTLRYAYDWHGKANDRLLELAKEAETRYDLFFLCGDDIPYADTAERDGIEQRTSFQKQIKSELITRKIPYIELNGSLSHRMEKVERVLNDYEKYSNLGKNIGALPEKQKNFYTTDRS